jgi:Uncharacterized conserved protein (DUF2203)
VTAVRRIIAGTAAVAAICTACGTTPRRSARPDAEFLLVADDSTAWVHTFADTVIVNRAPLRLATLDRRLIELYVAEEPIEFEEASFLVTRVFRRDLVRGDSTLLFADSTVLAAAMAFVRANPEAERLDDGDAEVPPGQSFESSITLLGTVGPTLGIEVHRDRNAGELGTHDTFRATIDLRTGQRLTLTQVVDAGVAGSTFLAAREALSNAVALAGTRRGPLGKAASRALALLTLDSLSFSLSRQGDSLVVQYLAHDEQATPFFTRAAGAAHGARLVGRRAPRPAARSVRRGHTIRSRPGGAGNPVRCRRPGHCRRTHRTWPAPRDADARSDPRSHRRWRFSRGAGRGVAAGPQARLQRVRLLFRRGAHRPAPQSRVRYRTQAGGTMTIGGESGSGARPLPASFGPRTDVAPISMELATQMLPLVRRIVADLRVAWEAWRGAVTRYDSVLAAFDADMDSQLARTARKDVKLRAADVDALRQELVPLGATCRSPRSGRVEWQTVVDGIPARLLWEPGEARVTRWEGRESDAALDIEEVDEDDPSRS